MKKTAIQPEKPLNAIDRLLAKQVDVRVKPLVLNIVLAVLFGMTGFELSEQIVLQQEQRALDEYSKITATLIDRQTTNWVAESNLLAQQPSLKSTARVKAIIAADGVSTAALSFTDQDILNRTRKSPTGLEISNVGARALITAATATPDGGYVISERPFSVLYDDLKKVTAANIQLQLSQNFSDGQILKILTLNDDPNHELINVPLKTSGWQLQIGKSGHHSLNPLNNLPILVGLLAFFASLASILIWFFIKQNRIASLPARISIDEQRAQLDAVALELAPSRPEEPAPIAQIPSKASVEPNSSTAISKTETSKPEPAAEKSVVEPIKTDLDELSYLEGLSDPTPPKTLETPETQKNNLMEFKLGDSILQSNILLPDAEFRLDAGLPKHIFRAYDIRGQVSHLSAKWMAPIARALGSELRARGQIEVVVGFDARTTSEEYAEIMRNGLVESGLFVIDIGAVPTPVMHYAARQHQGNGIMITASHSPADYNGIKWLIQQRSPLPEDIEVIYKRAQEQSFVDGKGQIRKKSYSAEYLDEMLNDVMLNDNLNVVIDGMHGVMGELAQQALETSGCTVIGLDITANGAYPHGNPDPCEPNRLTALSQQMVTSQADIGFAFDGDGDRMVAVTKDGTIVTSDQLISLFAMMILEFNPGADIVFDVKCSRMVSQMITANGGRPIMSRSGNTFIRHAVMSQDNAVAFGGEFSGHYFFNDGRGHASDDGLYAAMRLMEWLGHRGQTLEEILRTLPARVGTADIYLALDSDLPSGFFDALAADAAKVPDTTLVTIDGVRLDFQDGFGIIRASNTGAFITLRFESGNSASLDQIRQVFHDLMQKNHPALAAKMPH
jgi:phosphomannomutase